VSASYDFSTASAQFVELSHQFNKANDVVDPEAEYRDANKQYEHCDLPPE
jgi:hypothetical protein